MPSIDLPVVVEVARPDGSQELVRVGTARRDGGHFVLDLSTLRIGVRRQTQPTPDAHFAAFVDKLKALGAKPTDIGDPPTVAGSAGGLDEETSRNDGPRLVLAI